MNALFNKATNLTGNLPEMDQAPLVRIHGQHQIDHPFLHAQLKAYYIDGGLFHEFEHNPLGR